MTVLLR